MTYPKVRNSTMNTKATTTAPFVIELPTHSTGDLLLVVLRQGTTSSDIESKYETPSGWTLLDTYNSVFAKIATSSAESNPSFTGTNDGRRAHGFALSLYDYVGSDVASALAISESVGTSSPILTPSWGAAENLWIACITVSNRHDIGATAPENYGDLVYASSNVGSASTAFSQAIGAFRSFPGATQTPGDWEPARPSGAIGYTLAIRGTSASADPPQGTTTITYVSPATTSAQVTYSYSGGDSGSITGYEYRLDGGSAASIGESPATITGLTAATAYDLQVRALNENGAGDWSAIYPFETYESDSPPADAPGDLEAVAQSHTQINVTWSAVTGASGYEVEIDAGAPIDVGSVLLYEHTGLEPETEYSYRVRAYNGDGAGPWATAVQETTSAAPVVDLEWEDAPLIIARTTTSYTLSATPSAACTVYAVAVLVGSVAPDPSQIVEGTDGEDTPAESFASEASAGPEDPVELVLSGLGDDPAYDIYVVGYAAP